MVMKANFLCIIFLMCFFCLFLLLSTKKTCFYPILALPDVCFVAMILSLGLERGGVSGDVACKEEEEEEEEVGE